MKNDINYLGNLTYNSPTKVEIMIIEIILSYFSDRGISKERIFFADLPMIKIDDKTVYLDKKNTLDEIFELINDDDKIVINSNELVCKLSELGHDFSIEKAIMKWRIL